MENPVQEFTAELRKRLIIVGSIALTIIASGLITAYVIVTANRVSIDTASITAPVINLAPTTSGRLNAVYVNEGDVVGPNTPLFLVGTKVVPSKVAGLIVTVSDTVGAQVNAGAPVVSMIDPSQLRITGRIDENKGLTSIAVGDPVVFTVDAYGSTEFQGVIDEIAPMSNQSGIVFNISSQRQVQQFAVKARFDTSAYPQLKSGMSARMQIYTK